jgi:outer membrane protein assembly factor BamA
LRFKYLRISGIAVFCLLLVQFASAQGEVPSTKRPPADSLRTDSLKKNYDNNQMDVIDALHWVFRKTHLFKGNQKKSLAGPFIVVIPYPSYTIATGVEGVAPINISFYTNPKERTQLSFFNNNFQYTQFKQIIALSVSNVYFGHDKWELIGDYRFYNFPTYTYGLGSETTLLNEDAISYNQVRFYQLIMRQVVPNLSVGIGYHYDYHFGIQDFNAENRIVTDYARYVFTSHGVSVPDAGNVAAAIQQYSFTKRSTSSGASINLLYDSRDNTNTPLSGIYFAAQFRANLSALGSNSNYNSLTVDIRKYFRLPTKWYTELAFWGYMWLTTNGNAPYLDMPTTAGDMYNNTGRGYALGRFRGLNMLYFESEFRFSILRNGLLGGVVFANLESLSQWPTNSFGAVQPGVGLGLRIKINKKIKTSSAVDYGFGTGGSRGFAFNLNEVY